MRTTAVALVALFAFSCGTRCTRDAFPDPKCPGSQICDEQTGMCVEAYSRTEGEPCIQIDICRQDLLCNYSTDPGRCEKLGSKAEGESCSDYRLCQEGLVCRVFEGEVFKCGPVPAVGEMCAFDQQWLFSEGSGWLYPLNGVPCQPGLYCRHSWYDPGICQPLEPAGGDCICDADCQEGLYCSDTICNLPCSPGYEPPPWQRRVCRSACSATKMLNDCCSVNDKCEEGLTCYTVPDPPRCAPFAGIGEPCNVDSDCKGGYCRNGKC